MEPLHCTKDSL